MNGENRVDKFNATNPTADAESTDANPRRKFFSRGGLFTLGALTAAVLAPVSPVWAKAAGTSTAKDVAILNTALGLEFQAIAAYQAGAESNLLQKPVLDVAIKFQGHHRSHAEALTVIIEKFGGVAVSAKALAEYAFPLDQLKSQADVLRFAAGLEKGAASTYLGALPNFHNPHLIKGAGSILGDETMHWAILLNALGEDPVPSAFLS
jgi:rubrerythrin